MAVTMLSGMFLWHDGAPIVARMTLLLMIVLNTATTQLAPNTFELRHEWPAAASLGIVVLKSMEAWVCRQERGVILALHADQGIPMC